MPDAEKALMRCPVEPGPPRGLAMAPLSSPRPCHDVSLGKVPERGLGQAKIMGGWAWQSLDPEGFALWLVCWDVEITLFP